MIAIPLITVFLIILTMIITFLFIILHRDMIFYFNPRKATTESFKDFLDDYNAKTYKSTIGNIDVIDIPATKPIKKVIIYFHGNYGNITMRERILSFLSDSFNARIIAPDYLRIRTVSIKNLVKVANSIIKNVINEGIDIDDIIIWGESIGCAIALETVSVSGVKNFVMLAGFRSMRDMIGIMIKNFIGRFLKKFVYELNNRNHIKSIKNINMIVLHSKKDELIPYEQVMDMVEELKLEFYEIEGTHAKPIISEEITEKIKKKFKNWSHIPDMSTKLTNNT
jgi:predicted esterase